MIQIIASPIARCTTAADSAAASNYLLNLPLQHLNYQPIIQTIPWYTNWLLRNNAPDIEVLLILMKSGLSNFFAQMTNAFPPSISRSKNQISLKSSRVSFL